ncbi:carbohydrate ABC transporter permease [Frondihabitans cladoniiphilus]|uniref:Carbohydrate ABC transporter permease n=1 Tax=Frondihabitans cladoniiphilus TaxID=715785 RepID=A0ABP8WCI9_9MICO
MTALDNAIGLDPGRTEAVATDGPRPDRPAARLRTKRRVTPGGVVLIVALVLMCVLQLAPFWIAVTTALKSASDTSLQFALPLTRLTFSNFVTAAVDGGILRAIGNSVVITVASTVLTCLIGAFAAYPLARRSSGLNRLVFAGIVALIMVPPLSILVPLYSFLAQLHGTNTYWGIILVMVTGQLPLAIFLYSAFIRSIPVSLEEAAALDGASTIQIFTRIVLPLLKPVTATVVILTSVNVWNEFALSGYLLTNPGIRTIAPAIASFFSQNSNNLGAAAAASLMAVVPVLIAYLFLQRFFIKGMVAGAEK